MSTANISAIIPALTRPDKLLATLERIGECEPAPAEILVHIDENNEDIAAAVSNSPVKVKTIISEQRVGPGGGRHRLLQEASFPYAASFDDDSYPVQKDFFKRAEEVMEKFPNAVVVGASIFPSYRLQVDPSPVISKSRRFYGCGCIYRRDLYLQMPGYVPLPLAYGMEEVDLALQAHAGGHDIMATEWLQVIHDRDAPGDDSQINLAMVRNSALLAFLRYPAILFPVGIAQFIRQILWFLFHGRRSGVWEGIRSLPACLKRYRKYRRPYSISRILSWFSGKFDSPSTQALEL